MVGILSVQVLEERGRAKFGTRFNYSKFTYAGTRQESILICQLHGEFSTTPEIHWGSKHGGCPKCLDKIRVSALLARSPSIEQNTEASFTEWLNTHKPDFKYLGRSDEAQKHIVMPPCGHRWIASIGNIKKQNCGLCAKGHAILSTCLATTHSHLIADWHTSKNDNLTPSDITAGSNNKVWWFCKVCQDSWEAKVCHRALRGDGCPFCGSDRVGQFNNLAVRYPEIASEWHPTKNGTLMPEQVMPGTLQKVWWLYRCGHEAQQRVQGRTSGGKGCRFCSVGAQHSKAELRWLDLVGIPDNETHRQVKIQTSIGRFSVDGFLPELGIVYEFLGDFWHGNPTIYSADEINTVNHTKYGQLFEATLSKIAALKATGLSVCFVWENDFNSGLLFSEDVKGGGMSL